MAFDPTSSPSRNPADYCSVCGNRMAEIQLFTSKVKHCKVCEDRAKERKVQEAKSASDDDEITQALDELFKNQLRRNK